MKMTTHTGTKPYKLFSFTAIYILNIYRMLYCGHTVMLDTGHTVLKKPLGFGYGKKNSGLKITEICFMF